MSEMWTYKTLGIPDEMFMQSDEVPGPTKEEIRVLTISKARLSEGSVVVDVGCGTGGLTVEAALQVTSKGKVFAIDNDENAIKLTEANVAKFTVQNIVQIIKGDAQEVLLNLPGLDAALIGGSQHLREVIKAVN